MLKNKKYFLIFMVLILLLLFGMTMVSATDNTNTTLTDTDTITSADVVTTDNSDILEEKDNTINYEKNEANSISKEKTVVKQDTVNKNTKEATQADVSNYTELVQAVADFKNLPILDTYTINLLPGNYNATANMTWGYTMPLKTLIINGNGLVLDGGNSYQFMYVYSGILEINNITFTNYNSQIGAVINSAGNSTVTVKDSKFINNSASQGSAIFNTDECTITNCTFSSNSASQFGTVCNLNGVLNVIDSTFNNNKATISGGALIVENGTVTVRCSNFTDNSASSGAALYVQMGATVVISDSNFTHNHVTNFGGAIYIKDGSTVIISDSNFIDNSATFHHAGAICNEDGYLTLTSSNFKNNTAKEYGGAIYTVVGNLTVYDSNFTANNAQIGGALVNYGGNVYVNATFIDNMASEQAGAIFFYIGTNNFVNQSTFINNSGRRGGGIYNYGGILNITLSHFTNNSVNNYGGGICNALDGNVYITTSDFTENSAKSGGAIYNNATLNVYNSNFTSNTAQSAGAIRNIDGCTYKISNSQFIGNTPDNFVLYQHYVYMDYTDGYIPIASTIKLYDGNTLKYTGRLNSYNYLDYRISAGMNVRLVITGDDSDSFSENTYYVTSTHVTNFEELVEAVNDAKSSDTDSVIYLEPGNYNATSYLTWMNAKGTRKLTIIGNGITIDGDFKNPFVKVYNDHTLVLENLVLTRFKLIYGAVIQNNGGTVIVDHSSFIDNYARDTGGVIYVGDNSNLIVNDSLFEDNLGGNGGVIYGGNNSNITITKSTFQINSANLWGGVILIHNTNCSINECTFTNNHAEQGGAINIQENGIVNIRSSTFLSNTIYSSDNGGGAIYDKGTLIVDNSTFIGNTAKVHGGAIYSENYANVIVTNSIFGSNEATQNGGAIYSKDYGNLTLNGCSFDHNSADCGGAILINNQNASINDCNFTINFANVETNPYGGGGAIYTYSNANVTLNNSKFMGNEAKQKGGAINVQPNGIFTISGSTFNSNHAGYDGGAIYNYGGDVTVSTSDFNNNFVDYSGGAIYNYGKDEMTKLIISDSNFIENIAQSVGGALVNNYNAELNIINSNFTRNYASGGGAIYNENSTLIIIDSTLNSNNVNDKGGAILNKGTLAITNNSTLNNNKATNGGVIYNDMNGLVTITGSTLNNNSATNDGGVIYNDMNGQVTITGSTLNNNTARNDGGVIYNDVYGRVTITGSTLNNNTANDTGGVIKINMYAGVTITGSTLNNNTAKNGGVININTDGGVGIIGSTLNNNNAENGGVIYVNQGSVGIYDSTLNNNNANDGGVIYSRDYSILDITNSTLNNNFANNNGGAMNLEDTALTISNSTFDNNTANNEGGAIIKRGLGTVNITRSTLNSNNAVSGGAINGDGTITVIDSTFSLNTPENFIKNADNMIYLENADNYIPENAEVDLNVSNIIITGNMVNRLVQDFNLPIGNYNLSITVNPDDRGSAVRNTTYIIAVDASAFSLSADDISCNYSEAVNLTVTTSSEVSYGNVSVSIEGNVIGCTNVDTATDSVDVQIDTADYWPGTYTLDIVYTNPFTGIAIVNTSTLTINKIQTNIEYKINDTMYNDNVTISGKLTGSNGKPLKNVNVFVKINDREYKVKTDTRGRFLFTATAKILGINNVTLGYAGSHYYYGCESNTTFNVEKQDTIITYDAIEDVKFKDSVTVTGNVTDAKGNSLKNINVMITINSKEYKAKVDDTGSFSLIRSASSVGINNVTISFAGSDYYNGCETNTTFNVGKQDITITYDPIQVTRYKENVTISGKVSDANGNALKNINAIITIGGKVFKAKTDSTGAFTINITATAVGTNNVTISYGGSAYYNGYETNTTFNVEKQDIIISYDPIMDVVCGENVTITGRVADVNDNALGNVNAIIRINGKLYKSKTDSTGAFTFTTPTSVVGTNNVILGYAGNNNYNSYETTTTFNVIEI